MKYLADFFSISKLFRIFAVHLPIAVKLLTKEQVQIKKSERRVIVFLNR